MGAAAGRGCWAAGCWTAGLLEAVLAPSPVQEGVSQPPCTQLPALPPVPSNSRCDPQGGAGALSDDLPISACAFFPSQCFIPSPSNLSPPTRRAVLEPFLRTCGFRPSAIQWLPAIGPTGLNLVQPLSEPLLTAWWKGPTLAQVRARQDWWGRKCSALRSSVFV